MALKNEVVIKISAQPDASLNKVLGDAKDQVEKLTGNITDLAQKAAIGFGAFAVGAGALVKNWTDAAGAMEIYKTKLETVLKSSSAAQAQLSKAVEFAAKTPFDVRGIVDATTTLTVYGQKADLVLPRVGDLAAGMGKDIKETTLAFGKAMSGSLEGFESLRNEYGITTAKLVKYGAAMNEMGGISTKTAGDIEKARQALLKVVQIEFGGAMERQSKTWKGAMSNLNDSVDKLRTALGNELIPALTGVARVITGTVEGFNAWGGALKPVIAWGTLAAGAIAAMAVPAAGLIAILPALSAGWSLVAESEALFNIQVALTNRYTWAQITANAALGISNITLAGTINGLRNAFAGLAAAAAANPLGIILIAVGALAIASDYWKRKEDKRAQEMNEGIASNIKALKAFRTLMIEGANKSAADFKKMGMSVQDLDEMIKHLERSTKDAVEAGNQGAARKFSEALRVAKELKPALEALEKQYRDIQSALKDIEVEAKIFKETGMFKKPADEINYLRQKIGETQGLLGRMGVPIGINLDFSSVESAQAELRKAMQLKAQYDKEANDPNNKDESAKARAKMNAEAVGVMVDLLKQEVGAVKDNLSKRLKDSQDYISRQKDLNQMNISEEIKANERILATQTLTAEETKSLHEKIAVLKHDKAKESRELAVTSLKHELDAVKLMATGQVAAYDKVIKKIEEYKQARKITEKQAYEVKKEAETGKKSAAEKEEKDQYDRMVKAQENYLKVLDKNEEASFQDKMDALDAYERFWYEMERRRVVTADQAETQIMKIIEKRAALEKSIIDANKKAEQDLITMRKKALDDDISRLKEKAKSGQDVEKELMNKLRDRQKEDDHVLEAKQKEWTKQGVSDNKIGELGARAKAESYGKQAGELDDVIKDLQQKASNEEDRSTKMQLEGLISSLTEKRNTLSASASQETANANAFQRAGEAEGIQEPKTGFEGAVTNFEGAVGMFGNFVNALTGGQLPAGFSSTPGAGASQIPGVVNQAVSNQSSSASTVNNSYILGGQGFTPTADVQSKWAGLGAAIQQMQENGYLASLGGSLSY